MAYVPSRSPARSTSRSNSRHAASVPGFGQLALETRRSPRSASATRRTPRPRRRRWERGSTGPTCRLRQPRCVWEAAVLGPAIRLSPHGCPAAHQRGRHPTKPGGLQKITTVHRFSSAAIKLPGASEERYYSPALAMAKRKRSRPGSGLVHFSAGNRVWRKKRRPKTWICPLSRRCWA